MYDTDNLSMPIYMKLLVDTNYKHIMHMNIRFADKKTELKLLFVEFENKLFYMEILNHEFMTNVKFVNLTCKYKKFRIS